LVWSKGISKEFKEDEARKGIVRTRMCHEEGSHMALLQARVIKKILIINMLTKSSVHKVVHGLHALC